MSKVPPFGWLTVDSQVASLPLSGHTVEHGHSRPRSSCHLCDAGRRSRGAQRHVGTATYPCAPTCDAVEEERSVAWFRRRKEPGRPRRSAGRIVPISSILSEFVRSRRGVEAFIEPPHHGDRDHACCSIAHDGEWTRRRVDAPEARPPVRPPAVASRSTTSRWSATRSGCATTTSAASGRRPGRDRPARAQPLAATSSISGQQGADRDAGAALGPVAGRLAGVVGRAGDVDVRPRRRPSATNSRRNTPPCSMCPARSMPALTWRDVGDVGVHALAHVVRQRHRPGRLADRVAGRLAPARTAPACPSRRRSACPARSPGRRSAWTSRTGSRCRPRRPGPSRRRGSSGPRRRC